MALVAPALAIGLRAKTPPSAIGHVVAATAK